MSRSLRELSIGTVIKIISSGRCGTKVASKETDTKLDFGDFQCWISNSKLEGDYFEVTSEPSDFLTVADSSVEIEAETNFDIGDVFWKAWTKDIVEETEINPIKAIRELVDHTVALEMIGTTCMYINLYEDGAVNIRMDEDDIVFEVSACTFNGLGIDELETIKGVMSIIESNRDYFDFIMGWE